MTLQALIDKYRYPADCCDDAAARDILDELQALVVPAGNLLKQLETLAPLAAAATEGPWETILRHNQCGPECSDTEDSVEVAAGKTTITALWEDCREDIPYGHNAAFIAAARNFLTPARIAELQALAAAPASVGGGAVGVPDIITNCAAVLEHLGRNGLSEDLLKFWQYITAKQAAPAPSLLEGNGSRPNEESPPAERCLWADGARNRRDCTCSECRW